MERCDESISCQGAKAPLRPECRPARRERRPLSVRKSAGLTPQTPINAYRRPRRRQRPPSTVQASRIQGPSVAVAPVRQPVSRPPSGRSRRHSPSGAQSNRRTASGPLAPSTASPACQTRARAAPAAISGQRAAGHSGYRTTSKPSATAAATPNSVQASWARRQGRTSTVRGGNEPREPREVGFGRDSMA